MDDNSDDHTVSGLPTKFRDINLFVNIISKSRDEIYKLYPQSQFHIIHWDNESIDYELTVLAEYKRHNLDVHLVSDIISDYKKNKSRYHISKHDPHPSTLAHKIIAEYIAVLLR